jgi:Tfp pilus assembly protein PilF
MVTKSWRKFICKIGIGKKALDIKGNAAIRLNLALAYRDGSKFDLAKASLEKAVKLKPRFSKTNFKLAQL